MKINDWLRSYQYFISNRAKNRLFSHVLQPYPTFQIVSGKTINPENPNNTYMLLKKVGTGSGQVLYSGTMPNVESKILLSPFIMAEEAIPDFANCIFRFLSIANQWLDETGSELILDPDYYEII